MSSCVSRHGSSSLLVHFTDTMSVEKIPVVGSAGGGVSILFWNIHGQVTKSTGDKFADVEFLNVCKNF